MDQEAAHPAIQEFARWIEQGDWKQAERVLNCALASDPESIELLSHLGYFYYKSGRFSDALVLFNQRNRHIPPDANLCGILCDIHFHLRQYRQAKYWIRQSSKVNPRSGMNWKVELYFIASSFMQGFRSLCIRCGIVWGYRSIGFFLTRLGIQFLSLRTLREEMVFLTDFLQFLWIHDRETVQEGFAYHKTREVLLASDALPFENPHATILDIGTGKNTCPVFWAMRGCRVISLDGSFYGVEKCLSIWNRWNPDDQASRFHYACGDGCHLPFSSSTFDGVSVLCVLEHIPDDGDIACVHEIHRVLKPGGLLVLTVESSEKDSEEWKDAVYDIGYQSSSGQFLTSQETRFFLRNYSPMTLTERLAKAEGWETVDRGFYDDCVLPFRRWLDPNRHRIQSALLSPFQPLLSVLFYRKTSEIRSPSSIGYLILRKRA